MEHVEVLRDALRKAFRYGETHWQQADSEYARDHRKAGETMDKFRAWADETAAAIAPLSAPPPPAEAQPVAWRATVEGLRKFVTDATFRRFSPEIQRFYEPYKCGCCRAASPSAPVGMEVASLPALWRQREDNGEERTEFDKGYEQASDECAEALERALARQPAPTLPDVDDDDLTVAYMAGRHDGRKEAQQPAADEKPVGWWNGILPDVTDRSPYDPSIRWGADAENSGHDIPLYAGVNPSRVQQPAAVDDDTLESLIEESDGHWSEDEFRIEGPDLMRLLRDAALAGQQGGGK